MTRSVADALALAKTDPAPSALGVKDLDGDRWGSECLAFVRSLYGVAAKYPDAITAWRNATHKHRTTGDIPLGAPIWWGPTAHTSKYGHVAVYAGNGKCYSTDYGGRGHINLVSIASITNKRGGGYLGWSEDINGVRVIPAVPPKPKPTPNITAFRTADTRAQRRAAALRVIEGSGSVEAKAAARGWLDAIAQAEKCADELARLEVKP